MGEEKIFKDLTKKYAELAKCIHSKDKRSPSLIKSCSKRIALLDKLRVLEVSYLKCLKNKVKRGQKGGKEGDENEDGDGEKKEEGYNMTTKIEYIEEYFKNKSENQDLQAPLYENLSDVNPIYKNYIKLIKTSISNSEYYLSFNTDDKKLYWGRTTVSNNSSEGLGSVYYYPKLLLNDGTPPEVFSLLTILFVDKKSSNPLEKTIDINGEKIYIEEPDIPIDTEKKGRTFGLFNNAKERALDLATQTRDRIKGIFSSTQEPVSATGGKKTTYRLNGEKVYLLHKNKKVQRSIYVKDKSKTKYCKIDQQFILLSKLKIIGNI